jgi:hypothetical protein
MADEETLIAHFSFFIFHFAFPPNRVGRRAGRVASAGARPLEDGHVLWEANPFAEAGQSAIPSAKGFASHSSSQRYDYSMPASLSAFSAILAVTG